jgi:hypothetical protein
MLHQHNDNVVAVPTVASGAQQHTARKAKSAHSALQIVSVDAFHALGT